MRRTALRLSGVLALVVTGLVAMSSPTSARLHSPSASRHVIVVLRAQHHAVVSTGHRREAQLSAYAANREAESGVIAAARQNGATRLYADCTPGPA